MQMVGYQKGFFVCALVALGCCTSLADDAKQDEKATQKTFDMNEIVVTASRTEMAAVDAPQSVSVIPAEEIKTSPFERVEDIVRALPGIYNYRHYGQQTSGIQSPLSMRGVGKNRVLILVDGVPQNDSFNNSISWVAWGHIPKENIERIEIVRGPSSALYGSEGLGGVINIITKTPAPERETTLRAEGGTAETYAGYGFHSQTFEDFGLAVGGGYEESDGYYMVEDPADYETRRHRQVYKLLGKLSYALSPISDLSLSVLHYRHETGKGREYFYDELELNQFWMNYRRRGETVDLQGLAYLNLADKTAFQDTASDNYSSLLRRERMTPLTVGGDLQGSMALGSKVRGMIGVATKHVSWEYDDDYVTSSRDVGAEGKQMFLAPFANVDFRFFDDRLLLNAGARYDWIRNSDGGNWDSQSSAGRPAYDNAYDEQTWEALSPKLGVVWRPLDPDTTFRASGGKGFRAPSLFELYKVHVRQGGAYYREANPDLEPESIWSYDLGVDRFLSDTVWGRIAFYQSFAEDYIGDRLTGTSTISGGKTRYDYVLDNIGKVDIYGVEVEARWFATDRCTLFANYTHNHSEVAEDVNNPELEGNELPNEPRHAAHAGIRWRHPKWVDLSLIANYYADIYFDGENTLKESGYATVDVSVSRQFGGGLTAYASVENLFDEEYPISRSLSASDTIAPGAVVTAGMKCAF
jgi:outer membrane receptor protein involved in Fe transport